MEKQELDFLNQPLSKDYQEGVKELTGLLTHIPEQIRPYLVANFIKNIAKM